MKTIDQTFPNPSPQVKAFGTIGFFCSVFASDGKINIALLNFGNVKRLCRFYLKRQNKTHGFTWEDQDWIGLMIFKNFAEQDWIGFNFCRSGLDCDWKIFPVRSSLIQTREEHRSGLDQDWSQFWPDEDGSDCDFFENWRIGTGWDWEFILFWCDSSTNIETVSCDVILQICMEVYIFRSVAKAVLELFCYASTFVQTSHSVGIVLLAARWTQSSS